MSPLEGIQARARQLAEDLFAGTTASDAKVAQATKRIVALLSASGKLSEPVPTEEP